MDMVTALAELGVTAATLDAEATERLDRDGYVALPNVLSWQQVEALRARLARLLAAEGDRAGLEVHQEGGTDRLADLVNKGSAFEPCFTDSRALACIAHVLGEFKLSSLNSRAALPGQGHQGLHADWGGPVPACGYQVCNSIWLLDDFTTRNGATRVVPGSHRSGTAPRLAMPDPAAAHPDEVQITGRAWHGGYLQQPPVARRHPEPQRPAAPGAALLLHPPRQPTATGPEETHPPADPCAPKPRGPVHPGRVIPVAASGSSRSPGRDRARSRVDTDTSAELRGAVSPAQTTRPRLRTRKDQTAADGHTWPHTDQSFGTAPTTTTTEGRAETYRRLSVGPARPSSRWVSAW